MERDPRNGEATSQHSEVNLKFKCTMPEHMDKLYEVDPQIYRTDWAGRFLCPQMYSKIPPAEDPEFLARLTTARVKKWKCRYCSTRSNSNFCGFCGFNQKGLCASGNSKIIKKSENPFSKKVASCNSKLPK